MYYINKIVGFATNPFSVGLALIVVGLVAWRWRRVAYAMFVAALAWIWVWSMPVTCRWTGWMLENPWLTAEGKVPAAESYPTADVIVLLSGGLCANTNISDQGELCAGADRARFAAQLYRAGKAPKLVLTGIVSRESTVPFLRDLGVPDAAIVIDNDSKNTEQNASFTSRLLAKIKMTNSTVDLDLKPRPQILLVTSAFHMRRSVLMFRKYAPELEVIPAPADFEVLATCQESVGWVDFLPSSGALERNAVHLKEFIGYWGYRLLRT